MVKYHSSGVASTSLARVIGSKTGIARDIEYYLPLRNDPVKTLWTTVPHTNFDFESDKESEDNLTTAGKGREIDQSVTRALGETVERYSWFISRSTDDHFASYSHLDEEYEMVDYRYFRFYSEPVMNHLAECGTSLRKLDPEQECWWTRGTDLVTGETTFVPSELVRCNHEEVDEPLQPSTTDGLSCHESKTLALLNSLYEFIERDAFMTTWFKRCPPERVTDIDVETETSQLSFHLLDYQTGIDVPAVGCIGVNSEMKRPYAVYAGAAGPDYPTAIDNALEEASLIWTSLNSTLSTDREDYHDIDPHEITNLQDSLFYYSDPTNFGPLEFLLQGPTQSLQSLKSNRSFSDPKEELDHLLSLLADAGVTPVAVEITPPDIEALGLVVMKVIIPELTSLSLPSFPFDAHPRLANEIQTDMPHPYP